MLTDTTHVQLHERLIKNIGTPKWEKDLFLLDEVLMQEETARPGESLGWRIKETKQGLSIEPVWCIHTGTGWKHRKADIKTIMQHGNRLNQDSDVPLIRLVQIQDVAVTSAMLHLLQKHPRVFIGSRSSDIGVIKPSQFTLALEQNQLGIEWGIHLAEQEILRDIIQSIHLPKPVFGISSLKTIHACSNKPYTSSTYFTYCKHVKNYTQ